MPVGFDACMRCGKVIGGISVIPSSGGGSFCPSCVLIVKAAGAPGTADLPPLLRRPGPLPMAIITASTTLYEKHYPTRIDAIVSADGVRTIGDWMLENASAYLSAATAPAGSAVDALGYAHVRRTGMRMPDTMAVLFAWQAEPPELVPDMDPVGYVGAVGMTMYRLETFRRVTAAEWVTAKSDALFMLRRAAG